MEVYMRISVFFLIFLILILATPVLFSAELVCGDVNEDGVVTIVDALEAARFVVSMTDTINMDTADVNDDGEITIVDALLIALFYVGYIDELSCPTPEPTIEPTLEPTPVTGPDINGDWNLVPRADVRVLENQMIYDHGEEFWSGEVEMTGYVNDIMVMNVEKIVRYTPPGYTISYFLTTATDFYPYFTITVAFTDHGGMRLMSIRVTIEEDQDTVIEFQRFYSIPYPNLGDNYIYLQSGELSSDDVAESLSLAITLNRMKTLAIEAGTLYTLPYKPYDLLPGFEIDGTEVSSSLIYQGDIVVTMRGTVEVSGTTLILDYESSGMLISFASLIPPPLVFEILTSEGGETILRREVPNPPGEAGITNFYGIEPGTLEYYEYNQLFLREP
jgi:hypothetical protein